MNENIEMDPNGISNESSNTGQMAVQSGGFSFQRNIITACVVIEFVAILAAVVGVTPSVFWIAIQVSTIGAIVAFILAWKVCHPLAGTALAVLNALTCCCLWSVPWLISDSGLNKYSLIVILSLRVIGWTALAIINRRARLFLGARETGGRA